MKYAKQPQYVHANGQPCYGCQICLEPDDDAAEPDLGPAEMAGELPECSGCTPTETIAWCDVHGTPSAAYDAGYTAGFDYAATGRSAHVTDESIDRAARWLFRKDAPPGEPADAWERADDARKQIYWRSATMIGNLFNGWTE